MADDVPDVSSIALAANAVPGVLEAVAVVDRRLRAPGGRSHRAPEQPAPPAGVPIPGDRPAVADGPPADRYDGPATLAEALLTAATLAADRGTTYVHRDGSTDRQTYRELLDDGLRVLAGLNALGLRRGDPVLLQCADNRSFVTAFWACVLGGCLPTPVGPAPDYRGDNPATRKLRAAWELLDRPVVVTDSELRDRVAGLGTSWGEPGALTVASVADLTGATAARPVRPNPDEPVLNLLTSGSTGVPKCVRHANRSIVARTYAAAAANGFTEAEVSLNWMPLDHVGGMVMFNVRDVFLRCEHVNARTESFVRRPVNWLDWIDRFAATNTWAPNFAFALVNRYADEIRPGRWDLSGMRNICNAGEAVVARTAHRFLELLVPHGLPPDAMVPCWGMSETSSGVTYSRMDVRDRSAGTVGIDPASLDGQLTTVPSGTPRSVQLTEVGRPIAGVSLRIVDGSDAVLPEGRVGRLQVSGTTIMREYYRNPAANAAAFRQDGWFDTGDLAFLRDGRLTLTGRQKDMVIVNGANYPAHEIEAVVEQVPGVRSTCAAVCGVLDEDSGTDAVLVFFVPTGADLDHTVAGIRTALAHDLAMRPRTVVPVTADEFPRTASGKIQRGQLVEALAAGRFDGRRYDIDDEPPPAARDGLLERVWCPGSGAACPTGGPVVIYAPVGSGLPDRTGRLLGHPVGVVRPGPGFRVAGPHEVYVDPLDQDQHAQALTALIGSLGRPTDVVYAWDSGAESPPEASDSAPARLLTALAACGRTASDAEFTVVTRGALGVRDTDVVRPDRAALAGLVRTAVAEGMFAAVRLVDVPDDTDDADLARLAFADHGGDLVAVREGVGYLPKLKLLEKPGDVGVPAAFLPGGGTALITGGLGGLGRVLAEHLLVATGARLLIVGRTPEAELAGTGRDTVLNDLRELGDVRYAAIDVADAPALERAVADAERDWGRRLDMVAHLAGAPVADQWNDLSGHELRRESLHWLERMLRPKLGGCTALDALLDRRPGTSVVLYSSVNGFLGGSAFGAYAAANAAVDGFAHRWSARGHRVRCLAWSMWSGPGMNENSRLTAAAERRGLCLIEPSHGLALLLAALNQPRPYLVVGADPSNAHLHPHLAPDQLAGGNTLVAVVPDGSVDPETLVPTVAAAIGATGALAQVVIMARIPRDQSGAVDLAGVLAARDGRPARHVEPVGPNESAIARIVGDVLKLQAVGRDDSFFALGGDSIRLMQVIGHLNEWFGRELPISLLYENSTVGELAAAIEEAGVSTA